MYEKINQEILLVKEQLRKKEKLENLIKHAKENLQSEKKREDQLKKILRKEEVDVEKLEHLSIKGLFLSVLGSKEEMLDKEKREFLAAKLKYDECSNSIKLMEMDLNNYTSQLKELRNIENSYEDLIKKKEHLILRANDRYSHEILSLMEEAADLNSDIIELKEAITAGNTVLSSLENAEESLRKAKDWGTWDILGGGLISTSAKHSNIDEAVEYINEVSSNLNRFKRELSDVNLTIDIGVYIDSFDRFADYFFDGFLADMNVQRKIESSLDSVVSAVNRVSDVVEKLKGNCKAKEISYDNLELKISNIIEQARD